MEQAALVALLRRRRSGWAAVADAVEESGSALRVLTADHQQAQPPQGELFPVESADGADLDAALEELRAWAKEGLTFTSVLDSDYPQQLRTIHQRPPSLIYRGRLHKRDARGVAVVGTRRPSSGGIEQATDIATGLAERETVVISGLAEGIDTAAQTGALRAGGRTVAVIGTGQRRYFPAKNRALQEAIARDHAVVSQFWPDSAPTKTSFPMRNAVMSGYAAATVVIEAAFKSGARMQARLALQHGRPVFLMRSLLEHNWAREYADRPGCTVVDSADEVLTALDDLMRPATELVWA
jgi:DNA processing protein